MKLYLAYLLLITGSLWMTLPTVVITKPNPTSVKSTVSTARITPTAALERLFVSLKQWLGNYRKVLKKDASNYLGVFERGSVPMTVNFKPDGSIENFRMGCPVPNSTTVSQAPQDLQKLLANCPNR
jgi:hypothetical protein